MKVSDTVTSKAKHEHRQVNQSTGNGTKVPNSQGKKVERTLKSKNNLQQADIVQVPERKPRESLRKLRVPDKPTKSKPPADHIKEISPTVKKPWSSPTRRPLKSKEVPTSSILDMVLPVVSSDKVRKKSLNSTTTPESSDTEKGKRSQSTRQAPNKYPDKQVTGNAKTTLSKKPKVVLKRQLALDNAPSNLKESLSNSCESLDSINSVTQLLKIERSSFAYGSSNNSQNSAYEDDEEEEEIATGGVKSLAARWQAINDNNNAKNLHHNGILRKAKGGDSISTSNKASEDTKSKLFQAIQEHGMRKDAGSNITNVKKEKATTMDSKGSPSKRPSLTGQVSEHKLPKSQERRKSLGKAVTTTATVLEVASSSFTSKKPTAATVCSAAGMENKIARTNTSRKSSSSTSSTSSPALSSSTKRATTGVVTAAKKCEEFSIPSATKEILSNLTNTRPRSRSTSPIKSGSFSSASNKPVTTTITTQALFSRGRSTKRHSAVDTTATARTNSLTTPFNYDQLLTRRSRSVSSSPGLPSYAQATATSLAKQTNQIRDHKNEESTRTPNKGNNSYLKSHLTNANTSAHATGTFLVAAAAPAISNTETVRGQGQTKNVAVPSKNRISRDSHSTRKIESQQIARPLKNTKTASIKTSSVAISISPSTTSTTSKVRDRKKVNAKEDTATKSEIASFAKSDARGSNAKVNRKYSGGTVLTTRRKREEVNTNFSASLSASSSPASVSTNAAAARQKTKQQRIIPSIIMSEYVDGDNKDGKTTVLAHTKSLFIPLQFIEPLEPSCDIEEGSSLELKVRVKGAEAVIWVKENKIIANAPPDFEYFQEKSRDLYGLRIADTFLEDSGLYICEAYGAGGSEITCWCKLQVLETKPPLPQEEDDEDADEVDISWEDLNMSEEIKSPQPLVVPVIVTSQAEQESEPNPPFETATTKDPSPVRTVTVQQVDRRVEVEERHGANSKSQSNQGSRQVCKGKEFASDQFSATKQSSSGYQHQFSKSSRNESAYSKSFVGAEQTVEEQGLGASRIKSQFSTEEQMITKEREKKFDPITDANALPAEEERLATLSDTNQQRDKSDKRKLISELSSASDESINLKEPRSGDEGVLSSAEENLAYVSLDAKSNVTNDEDITAITSMDASSPFPPVSSPCSEQNGRSSSVDSAIGFIGRPLFSDGKFPPRILVGPNNIIALYDEVVHLRVKVQNYGIPKTSVNWFKFINGTYKKLELNSGDQSSSQGDAHLSISKCGTSLSTLTITHVNYDDCGRYRVKVQNLLGMDSHDCLLTVEGPPEAPGTPPKVKYDDKSKTILIQWSSCPYDGGSKITGYYVEASIVQGSKTAINRDDLDNWQLLTPQSYSWLCYTLTNPKRGSVYRFRVFGENSYGKGKPTEPSLPLLVPVLMEGRRAGSSDALLWSIKSLSPEETSLRSDSNRKLARERGNDAALQAAESTASLQEEEEPIEYKNVTIKRDTFNNVYDKLDELGKGRFGIVFEVLHKATKKSYAGKFVKCIKAKDKERVQLEVKIMNDLGYHPKLICLIDAFEMPREIVIVTQRINGGELFERVVADDFTLTEGDCITFLRQICDAVRFIHAKNIMHLDLKPENILCTSKDSNFIKIIDFGLAQYYDAKEPIRVLFGTAEFVSPEIINYEPIAPSTDNWSIGVITYILLSGLSPFMGDNDNETFSNITRAEFDFEDEAFEKISDDSKDFISNLIVKRPEKRLTAEQCLKHRWLKQESVECKKGIILPTDKLKRFLVRRKWQKTGNAIRALSRMTTLYSRRSSSASSSSPNGSMSVSSPPPTHSYRSGSLALQESAEDNVFFSQSLDNNLNLNNNINCQVEQHVQLSGTKAPSHQSLIQTKTIKSKFSDPSRSDSGVCDVGGSFSSSISYD